MRNKFTSLISIFLMPLFGCDLIQAPIVNIEMTRSGFHRDLLYSVQFDYPLAGKDCEYVLEQQLPAAVYVSVDEMNDLKRLKKLNAVYPKFVDIEITTEKAQPLSVLLKGIPKITDSIKLPIHFRYHTPREDGTFVGVDISNPNIYMRCPDDEDDLSDTELQATPNVSYCLNENLCSFTESSENPATADDCVWKRINANIQLKSPLNAKIPVGNEKAFPPILYATILVSWVVSLYTVLKTHHDPGRINQRLEEQRIQQNKLKTN